MSKNQTLFKEAIADAQIVRRAAVANAKKTLEEALQPKVESMINKQLSELEEKEIDESEDKNEGLSMKNDATNPNTHVQGMEEELEEILAELGMEDSVSEGEDLDENEEIEENEELDEIEDLDENDEEGEEPTDDFSDESEEMPDDSGEFDDEDEFSEEGEEPQEVVDLTVDQLKSIIGQVVADAMGGGMGAGEEEMPADDAGLEAEPGLDSDPSMSSDDEEVNIDELMAELDENSDDLNEEKVWYNAKRKGKIKGGPIKESGSLVKPLNRNAKNLAPGKGIKNEEKVWYNAKRKGKIKGGPVKESGSLVKPLNRNAKNLAPGKGIKNEVQKELNEAVKVIKSLKETLNTTNLLNAKLLYVNKIFKGKSLTESQKIKVISAFDKARTKEEAKLIYESLNEAFTSKRNIIKESMGFASKPTGNSKPQGKNIIVEDATVQRFQQLAGLSSEE